MAETDAGTAVRPEMTAKFLSDAQLEGIANRLLGRYESQYGAVSSPPVPVERILEDVLDLNILWDKVSESPGQTILAELDSGLKTVVFNETRRTLITETPGLYHTILAHEAGHWEAHVDHALIAQSPLPGFEHYMKCLYQDSGPGQDPRELQAHRFMGFLLMPTPILLEAARDVDPLSWPALYRLRDFFQVTISALTIRLERLGLVYVTAEGKLHPSRQEYEGQMRFR